jgi:phosphoribosyl 1,2-cyclic phosphodiesterase
MRMWILGSGSKGNAILLEAGDTRVLLDVGFGVRALASRLASAGVAGESITACIITHEHIDHVRGAAAAAQRWGWQVHATRGTIAGCVELAGCMLSPFRAEETLTIGALQFETLAVSHDAAEPVALIAMDRETGTRTGIVYDLGIADDHLRTALTALEMLVLEANHDREMLRTGPYPWVVRQRIASPHGHLSNEAAAEVACVAAHRGLRRIVLAHLSETNNTPADAVRTVGRPLRATRFRGTLQAASQSDVLGPISAAAPGGYGQLSLTL